MSVPDCYIDPPEDLVDEGDEAYRKWEEEMGPLPEPEELDAEPCDPEELVDPGDCGGPEDYDDMYGGDLALEVLLTKALASVLRGMSR